MCVYIIPSYMLFQCQYCRDFLDRVLGRAAFISRSALACFWSDEPRGCLWHTEQMITRLAFIDQKRSRHHPCHRIFQNGLIHILYHC